MTTEMPVDLSLLQTRIEAARQSGDVGLALPLLDEAVGTAPDHAGLRILRAVTRTSAGRFGGALEDFNHVLAQDQDMDVARFHRALLLFGQDRLGEALEDFIQLSRRRPETVEPWANGGMILTRMRRFAEAVPMLRVAVRLSPAHRALQRALANALRGAGEVDEAMQLYDAVARAMPNDPAALTDHGMALLGRGDAKGAHARFLRTLEIAPADQAALAGLYLSANELGQHELVNLLMDTEQLLAIRKRPESIPLDRDALRTAVLSHPGLVWQPAGRSTFNGEQSPMLDLSPGSAFAEFGQFIQQMVGQRLAELRDDAALRDHPWVRRLPQRWRLQAWCTVLTTGGRQTPHIHPAGRLSGVYYLDVGVSEPAHSGILNFGQAPEDAGVKQAGKCHQVPPQEDYLCSFPSYFFHHTEPFQGTGAPRISLAFDVLPLD